MLVWRDANIALQFPPVKLSQPSSKLYWSQAE